MELREEQAKIVYTKDKDILVSAGAGSGKTFVMIERIVDEIINEKLSVINILVVTFTNASATEMKQRLEEKLKEALVSRDLNGEQISHIKRQLDLLGQANICTLHKFCQNIIKKYFYFIDIDPTFNIVDENDAKTLSNDAMKKVLEITNTNHFYDDVYIAFDNKRNNKKVAELIEKTYNFLSNQLDLTEFKTQIDKMYNNDIDKNQFAIIINNYIVDMFDFYAKQFQRIHNEAMIRGFDTMVGNCEAIIVFLQNVNRSNMFTQNHYAIFNMPDLPSLRGKVPDGCEDIQEEVKIIKKKLTDKIKSIKEDLLLNKDISTLMIDLEQSHKLMNSVIDLVQIYRQEYASIKSNKNVVDFADLEQYALKLLSNNIVCEQLKNTYLKIYVDEYQDINNIQEAILSKLYASKNVFLVGDIKQSIYGFRNTNPQIFKEKNINFAKDENIDQLALSLNYNFRSDKKILNFINYVFNKLMTEKLSGIDYEATGQMDGEVYEENKNGLPIVEVDILKQDEKQKIKEKPTKVYSVADADMISVVEVDEAKSEASIIITKINDLLTKEKQIYDNKAKCFRNIRLSDITLLTRSRGEYLNVIIDEIANHYAIDTISNDTIFDEYEIQILYCYLSLVNNICDDNNICAYLLSPLFEITENDLSTIRLEYKDNEYFYQCVQNYIQCNTNSLSVKLNNALSYIYKGRTYLQNNTIFNLLNWFINETHYDATMMILPNGSQREKNIKSYLNSFIGRSYNNDLFGYINYVKNSTDLPKISGLNVNMHDCIRVETMHQSKGLEYPIIFLVDSGHQFNKDSLKSEILFSNDLGLGLYKYNYDTRVKKSTIARGAIKISLSNKEFAENLRLLYVAMTRAKNHLYIVGKLKFSRIEEIVTEYTIRNSISNMALILTTLSESELYALKNGKTNLTINKDKNVEFKINVYDVIQYEQNKFNTKPIKISQYNPEFEQNLHSYFDYKYNYLDSTTKALKTSVTTLLRENAENETNHNNMPIKFNIKESDTDNLLSNPQIGIIYHKIMQLIDFNLDSLQSVEEFCNNTLSIDELKLVDCSKILSCIRQIRPMISGADKILREQEFLMYIPYNELVESGIVDRVLIQGIVDLIIVKDNEAILIDYKTTSIKDSKKLADKYALQLLSYQKAVEKSLNCKVVSKIIYSFFQEVQIIV